MGARLSGLGQSSPDLSSQDAATAVKNDLYNGEPRAATVHGSLLIMSSLAEPAHHTQDSSITVTANGLQANIHHCNGTASILVVVGRNMSMIVG